MQRNFRIAITGPVVGVGIKASETQIFFAFGNGNVTGLQLIFVMVGDRTGNTGQNDTGAGVKISQGK